MCAVAQNGFNRPDFNQHIVLRQKVSRADYNVYGTVEVQATGGLHDLKALWIDLKGRIGDAAASKAV
jgi:hypothetical protein